MGKHLTVRFPVGNSWSEQTGETTEGGCRQGLEVEKSKAGLGAACSSHLPRLSHGSRTGPSALLS